LSAACLALDAVRSLLPLSRKPHILIACMPKAGSTFLATALSELPGFRRCRLTPEWGRREQELCPIRLSRYNHNRYVAQHHLRQSEWTQHLIEKYNLTPVVLIRNLADCVISLRDHFRKEPGDGPMAILTPDHLKMTDAELDEAIVRTAMPWYANFYAGWRLVSNVGVVDYDDLLANPAKTIADVLASAKVLIGDNDIAEALERCRSRETRFNVGTAGRGSSLSIEAAMALLRLMESYPYLEQSPLFVKTRNTLNNRSGSSVS
jgi:hypothetical protein